MVYADITFKGSPIVSSSIQSLFMVTQPSLIATLCWLQLGS